MSTKCCSNTNIKILKPCEEENGTCLKDVPEGQFFQLMTEGKFTLKDTPAVMIKNSATGVHFVYCHRPLEEQHGYQHLREAGIFMHTCDARAMSVILLDLEEATFRQRRTPQL